MFWWSVKKNNFGDFIREIIKKTKKLTRFTPHHPIKAICGVPKIVGVGLGVLETYKKYK